MADSHKFDPARDGFGFRNPVGWTPNRTGGGPLLRRFYAFAYGKGLCFGMAAAALTSFAGYETRLRPPLAELSLTPGLFAVLREYQLRQFHPRMVYAAVRAWVDSGGGRPGSVLERLRLVGTSPDPHILCFGPALNQNFFACLARAHAVVPYRVEEGRVYVYDPNYPRDRGRFLHFVWGGEEFVYDGFRAREGWGVTLVPVSACLDQRWNASLPNRVEWTGKQT